MRIRRNIRKAGAKLGFHGFGVTASLIFVAPFVLSVLASFKTGTESAQPPFPPWPVNGFSLANYHQLTKVGAGLATNLANSATVTVATVLLTVILSTLAGYGFSRFRFPFRNTLFVLLISTLMIPFQSILTPLFVLLTRMGLNNTLLGLVLVYVTLQMPFAVFMMRNAFDAVPKEIEEAAVIDGASGIAMSRRILLPLVAPGVVTVAIFTAFNAWNEFLAALIFLTDQDKYTMPLLITAVRAGRMGDINWGAVQAGVVVMTVPCLLLFILLQRYYMRGLMSGAVK